MTEKKAAKRTVDWDLIQVAYRTGNQTVRQLASEHGISHTAIQKKAKAEGWTRDLSKPVQDKAKELVAKAEVAKSVAVETKVTEQVVVNVMAQKVADIDLANRSDLQGGIDVIRGLTQELARLSRPEFSEWLDQLAEACGETYTTESGRVIKDKFNELYRYIVGIQGRIKMVKDLAGAVGVYIPLQRKVVGLDAEKAASDVDDLLLKIAREKGLA